MPYDVAGGQILANPVSGFLQGRAIRQSEEETDQAMELRGKRDARDAEAHEMAKEDRQVQYDEMSAKKAYAGAQQVLAVPKGERKDFVRKTFPDFVKQLEQGGYGAWDDIDEDEIEELATIVTAQASKTLGLTPGKPEAVSPEGKVMSDVQSGILTPEQGNAALAPKNTLDFDNFVAAQKDPAFAQFLKDKRGKGLSMTLPDGTVIEMGGEGGGVSPGEIKNPVATKLQDTIVAATDELDRLNAIGQGFDPQFLQIPGRLKGGALKIKDLAGGMLGNMSKEETDYLTKFSTFKAEAAKNLSSILNRLSGAAISPAEGERLKKGIPNDEDSPTQFIAKYNAAVKDSSRAIMRANWALKNGIGVKSVEQLSKVMPLGGIDQVYAEWANRRWQELGGTPESKAQAVKEANQEFGLAR
jgi:hypothetical protein